MSRQGHLTFDLTVGPLAEADVAVRRVRGVEALSAPYSFHVGFTPSAPADPLDLDTLLGQTACLAIRRPDGAERLVHGLCTGAELTRVVDDRPSYEVLIEPRLALLAGRHGARVFQEKTAVEIACAVLAEHQVSYRQALSGSYPAREMCIQYRETDLAFVSRLLAEEGITFWFEHTASDHVLVLADAPSAFVPLPGGAQLPLRLEGDAQAGAEEHVSFLRHAQGIRSARAELRGYDFERPLLELKGTSSDGSGEEHYDYPAGLLTAPDAPRRTRLRLDELRNERATWSGTASCARFAPGYAIEIVDHPEGAFDGRQVLTRVEHDGTQDASAGQKGDLEVRYQNRFRTIPAGLPWRPPRRRRPALGGPQTATVVGPSGEEIHVDAHGRVKVQFHWDREGKRDERSSAWVRLAQAWSGAAWGASFVPRIGQEVVVRFLEGNPDRPLVIGAVFNGLHVPPAALPGEKTQSALRTDSSPGGGGYNELRFEDAADAEQVSVHAQRDENIRVLNDKTQAVGANEQLRVEQDRSQRIGGFQFLRVAGNERDEVRGDQSLDVTGNRMTRTGGDHTENVAGDDTTIVVGNRFLRVEENLAKSVAIADAVQIGTAYHLSVSADENETVGLARITTIGGDHREAVEQMRTEQVEGDEVASVGGDYAGEVVYEVASTAGADVSETVDGKSQVGVKGTVALRAGKFLYQADSFTLIVGGKKILSMKSSGQVVLAGTSVGLTGTAVAVKGSSIAKLGPAAPPGGSAQVKKLPALPGARAFVQIELKDQHGRPVVNELFQVELPDGTVREGRLDGSGRAQIPGAKAGTCKICFPRLDRKAWRDA